jgi:hypothetical protein
LTYWNFVAIDGIIRNQLIFKDWRDFKSSFLNHLFITEHQKLAFMNWKSRNINRENVPELLCYVYISRFVEIQETTEVSWVWCIASTPIAGFNILFSGFASCCAQYNNTQRRYHLSQQTMDVLFIILPHYMFRPISRPSSSAFRQIAKRSRYWVISPWIHRVMILP